MRLCFRSLEARSPTLHLGHLAGLVAPQGATHSNVQGNGVQHVMMKVAIRGEIP